MISTITSMLSREVDRTIWIITEATMQRQRLEVKLSTPFSDS
jgi:hypothetical protein